MNRDRFYKEFEHLLTSDDVAQNTHPIHIEGDRVSWVEDPFVMSLVALGILDFHQTIQKLADYPEKQRELARKMGYSLQSYEKLSYVKNMGESDFPQKRKKRRK